LADRSAAESGREATALVGERASFSSIAFLSKYLVLLAKLKVGSEFCSSDTAPVRSYKQANRFIRGSGSCAECSPRAEIFQCVKNVFADHFHQGVISLFEHSYRQ
jgi:hypothetical protein